MPPGCLLRGRDFEHGGYEAFNRLSFTNACRLSRQVARAESVRGQAGQEHLLGQF